MITTEHNYRSIPAFHSRLTRINHDSRESSVLKISTENSDIISSLRQPSRPVQGVKDIKINFIGLYEPRERVLPSKQTFKEYTTYHLIIHHNDTQCLSTYTAFSYKNSSIQKPLNTASKHVLMSTVPSSIIIDFTISIRRNLQF